MPLVAAAGILTAGNVGAALIGRQKAPGAAAYTPVDPQEEQRKAIQGNLANTETIEQLLTRANNYTQNEANSLMEKAVPGYASLSKKFMEAADVAISDPYSLPPDVQNNLTRIAAERGISMGLRGQAGDFSAMRDLGLNMLDYGNSRMSQASSLLSTIASLSPRVSPMSPMSLWVTPAQAIGTQQTNNQMDQSVRQGAMNAAAAASNANASMWAGLVSNIAGMGAGMVAGMKTGGGVGAKTTYADFIRNNPNSSAATGQQFVDTTWNP